MYRYNMIPTINKPTGVGKNSATAIDHKTASILNTINPYNCLFLLTSYVDLDYHFK